MADENEDATSEQGQETEGTEGATSEEQTSTTEDSLGEGGKAAIAKEREARRKAEKAAREAQAELDRIRQESLSESERAVAAARSEGYKEALAKANKRLLHAEVRAAAAGLLADPSDALRLIDLDDIEVDEDGTVDTEAITAKVKDLVKAKPYLAATAPPKPKVEGDAGQGAGEGRKGEDLASLPPEEYVKRYREQRAAANR